jgi:hypothetical protein
VRKPESKPRDVRLAKALTTNVTARLASRDIKIPHLDVRAYRHTGRAAARAHAVYDRNFAAAAAKAGAAANAHIKHLQQQRVGCRNIVFDEEVQTRCK